MRVVVCGAGLVGQGIVQYLASEDIDVIVVDENRRNLEKLEESVDVQTVHGKASLPTTLSAAGAQDADLLVAVTSSDEINMIACQVAHSLFGVPMKIAHLRDTSYLDPQWSGLFSSHHMPIDVVISPEKEVAHSIRRSLEVPGAVELLPVSGDAYVVCTQCLPGSSLAHTPLSHVSALFSHLDISILGIVREQELLVPGLNDEIAPLDYVYFSVGKNEVHQAMVPFGYEERSLKDVLIMGGGNIGVYLARMLSEDIDGITVRIIEHNPTRAKYVAQTLNNTLVLSGDGLESSLLEEANVRETQAVVAVTNDNEVNLLASLMAKRFGKARTVSIVNNPNYSSLVTPLGIDVVVSPRSITISSILRHVRRGNIRFAHTLLGDVGEIIEVNISEGSTICGEFVTVLDIPGRLKIGLIVRGDKTIFPTGKESIQAGDKILLLASNDAIVEVERFAAARSDFF